MPSDEERLRHRPPPSLSRTRRADPIESLPPLRQSERATPRLRIVSRRRLRRSRRATNGLQIGEIDETLSFVNMVNAHAQLVDVNVEFS